MDEVIIILTSFPDAAGGEDLAIQLIELKLAACVNLMPQMKSFYCWQGVLEVSDEVMLLIKTTRTRYNEVELVIKAVHPYKMPEIVVIQVAGGESAYLHWLSEATEKDAHV